LLDPDLNGKEKRHMIEKIINRSHYPLPGITLTFTKDSINRYISSFREQGFEGLLPKQHTQYLRRYKNIMWATFKINMNDPLASMQQLRDIIAKGPETSPEAKDASLKFLDQCLTSLDTRVPKYKPIYLDRSLTDDEIDKLESYVRRGSKNNRNRAIALLMANEQRTMPEIILASNSSAATAYRWFNRFKEEGIDFIETKINKAKTNIEFRERVQRITKIIHCPPGDYGINRTAWRLEDIAKVYENKYHKKLSIASIRRSIKKTGYSYKRAIRVLTSPDPEYLEKTKKVLKTLRNLGPHDAFFFIDEGGPYQVKKYGGKSWTPKGATKTFPQFQTPKGRVTFIGALDALKNQVTLFFTKSKNTAAVVCLIKILFYRYHGYSTLYLTWDCASWHRSKGLQKCLNKLNADEKGPNIKVVPLPKQSQFLNVIESVFSGMKKAVIFNSDYQSEYEMKVAIDRHFQERNEYFKANPKRAGNKIWDKEYYNLDELDSGLFRRM